MENPPTYATKNVEGARPRRGTPTRLKSWTLLVVGELGHVASFRVTVPWVAVLITGVAVVVACVAFATVSYYAVGRENRALKKHRDELRAALMAADKAKETALVRLMVLEGKTKPEKKEKQKKKKDKPAPHKRPSLLASKAKKPPAPAPKKTETSEAPSQGKPIKKENKTALHEKTLKETSRVATAPAGSVSATGKAQGAAAEETKAPAEAPPTPSGESHEGTGAMSSESLLVENLQVWTRSEDDSVRFQFDLKNMDSMGRKINGYAFVVFKPEEGSQEPLRASPWTPLEDGKPTIYKRGQYFSIARFKLVRGRMPQIRDVGRFKTATIYVYSETGSLLLEKEHEVNDIVRS